MWWKKYSGYIKPLDKLEQWTEVNKMEFSKVKCEVLLIVSQTFTASVGRRHGRQGRPGRRVVQEEWPSPWSCASAQYTGCPHWGPTAGPGPRQSRVCPLSVQSWQCPVVILPSRGCWLEAGVQGRGTDRLQVRWKMPGSGWGRPPLSPWGTSSGREGLTLSPLGRDDGEAGFWLDLGTDVLTRAVNRGGSYLCHNCPHQLLAHGCSIHW